ncbi:putative reverse transcriptase domain, reverse transcriptase zinc-binding domain protein [Tanacetum coccineum]
MISWIMECVTTTSYSICINGTLHGYFQGKRGLRQGDPLSPYLFTLVMEVLTLMIQRRVLETNQFTFTISILNVLPFKEGHLPVKYLGVPLISSRLMVRDYKELVEKNVFGAMFGNLGCPLSLCVDKGCDGLVRYIITSHLVMFFRSGLTYLSVNDIVRDGVWDWPRELLDKYPILDGCYTHLSNECDRLEWRLHDGTVKHFSVSQVWSSIRPRGEKVPWFDMIWFALNIPRHAFNMWLIINHKLKTQDRINAGLDPSVPHDIYAIDDRHWR